MVAYDPIMTVQEARKLLGKRYKGMTDEEIERIVDDTHELAKLTLNEYLRHEELQKISNNNT
jgi:type I restriction-modification system DNA methylase subunit